MSKQDYRKDFSAWAPYIGPDKKLYQPVGFGGVCHMLVKGLSHSAIMNEPVCVGKVKEICP